MCSVGGGLKTARTLYVHYVFWALWWLFLTGDTEECWCALVMGEPGRLGACLIMVLRGEGVRCQGWGSAGGGGGLKVRVTPRVGGG